jgi:hypothetical protein
MRSIQICMGELSIYLENHTIREVCAPTYCGNGYIEDLNTSIWDCGVIPSERLLDRDFEHTIDFGLSKGKKLIDELH